jgi:hypothetical protein
MGVYNAFEVDFKVVWSAIRIHHQTVSAPQVAAPSDCILAMVPLRSVREHENVALEFVPLSVR